MASLFLHMGTVTASLFVLLVLLPLPIAHLLLPKRDWSETLLGAFLIGTGSQSAIGLVWSHVVGHAPGTEAAVYLCLLTGGSLFSFLSPRLRQSVQRIFTKDWIKSAFPLLLVLIAAFAVRSIHPLQTAALGQSDAYTHLHYLRHLSEHGKIFNIVYPAGYHWLLALPVLLFGLDPYLVARFAGAFFGTALVLAIYVVLERLVNRRPALLGSFCAACFPGMNILIKTGIGAFANQFGLLLIPCILYLYALLAEKKEGNILGLTLLFIIALLGLAASVPMMLLHIFIIFLIERLVALLRTRRQWLRQTLFLILLCLPAVLLASFHFWQAGSGQRFNTARVLIQYGGEEKATTEKVVHKVQQVSKKTSVTHNKYVEIVLASPYFQLVVDFFTIKRFGFGNFFIDLMGWALLALYLICLGYGVFRQHIGITILGTWGALTTVQASSGFLQFSSYQREGWSLLVATCCLSGVLAGLVYDRIGQYRVMRGSVSLCMFVIACWEVLHPPGHPTLQSSAESLLIESVRFVGESKGKTDSQQECNHGTDNPLCGLLGVFTEDLPLTIVTRYFVGWQNQGDIVPNVLPPESPVTALTVNSSRGITESFTPDRQYLVLLDREKVLQPQDIVSAFAMVAPSQVESVFRQQRYLYRANKKIASYLLSLPKKEWYIEKKALSKNLTAYAVVPRR
nr:glycosyltransferase family 39 protein [Candidatus Electrothrix aestuarii]